MTDRSQYQGDCNSAQLKYYRVVALRVWQDSWLIRQRLR